MQLYACVIKDGYFRSISHVLINAREKSKSLFKLGLVPLLKNNPDYTQFLNSTHSFDTHRLRRFILLLYLILTESISV